jgi:hypothetical protein
MTDTPFGQALRLAITHDDLSYLSHQLTKGEALILYKSWPHGAYWSWRHNKNGGYETETTYNILWALDCPYRVGAVQLNLYPDRDGKEGKALFTVQDTHK